MTRLSFSFLVPLSVAAAALTLTACDVSVGTGFDGSDTDGGLWQDDGKVTGGGFDPRGADLKLKTGGPWLINGVEASQDTCDAAKITKVALVFVHEGEDYLFPEFTFDCVDGRYESTEAVLQRDTYSVVWSGINADGDEVLRTNPLTLAANPGSDTAVVNVPNFATLNVAIELEWDTDKGPGFSSGECADDTTLAEVNYTLYSTDGGDMEVVDVLGEPCVDLLLFVEPSIEAGKTYRLDIEGGGKDFLVPSWAANCTGLMPGVGTDGKAGCQVHYVAD